MKKIMMAAAIVCAAIGTQAATVNWKSGSFYAPESDGTFSATKLGASTVNAYVWLVDAETYGAATEESIAALNTSTANLTGKNSAMGATSTLTDKTTFDADAKIYSLILYTYNDGVNDWTLANKATAEVDSLGSQVNFVNIAGAAGAGVAFTHTGWTSAAVPEPTSGLLLLLGMAGLALRRRRA